jgi:hypothetical protein
LAAGQARLRQSRLIASPPITNSVAAIFQLSSFSRTSAGSVIAA